LKSPEKSQVYKDSLSRVNCKKPNYRALLEIYCGNGKIILEKVWKLFMQTEFEKNCLINLTTGIRNYWKILTL
jgi:hypothetical protein